MPEAYLSDRLYNQPGSNRPVHGRAGERRGPRRKPSVSARRRSEETVPRCPGGVFGGLHPSWRGQNRFASREMLGSDAMLPLLF